MEYIEILILASVDANELAGLLHQPGLLGVWEDQERVHIYWETEHWTADTQKVILHALKHLEISDPEQHIRVNKLPWQNWNTLWARLVKPIRIGQRFLIRPSWESSTYDQPLIELIIDPKQAFGTGHHITTQLVIELMEEIIVGNDLVLDIGTGSGILAMAAIRLGAQDVLGIDTDAMAIQCAQEYALVNSFHEEIRFHVGTLDEIPAQPFDMIFANLDRRTLVNLSKDLHRYAKLDTRLLVSGILIEDMEAVGNALTAFHWSVIESRQREEWAGLHLTYKS